MTPRLRPCGNPECRICRWNDEEHHDSGHVDCVDTWMNLLLGAAAIVMALVFFFVLLPALLA